MSHPCEHCGEPTTERYCDDDGRLADKTGIGPKACVFIAGRTGYCEFHGRDAADCDTGVRTASPPVFVTVTEGTEP